VSEWLTLSPDAYPAYPSTSKLQSTFEPMLCNQEMLAWKVLQRVGLVWLKHESLRKMLPEWKL